MNIRVCHCVFKMISGIISSRETQFSTAFCSDWDSMSAIIRRIFSSKVPVVSFLSPQQATSYNPTKKGPSVFDRFWIIIPLNGTISFISVHIQPEVSYIAEQKFLCNSGSVDISFLAIHRAYEVRWSSGFSSYNQADGHSSYYCTLWRMDSFGSSTIPCSAAAIVSSETLRTRISHQDPIQLTQRVMRRANLTIFLVISSHDLLTLFRSKSVYYEIVAQTVYKSSNSWKKEQLR